MQLEKRDWSIKKLLPEIDRLPSDWALIPVGNSKRPAFSGWESSRFKAIDFHRAASTGVFKGAWCGIGGDSPYEMPEGYCRAVGVLCGEPSGGLLFLDHDGRSCDPLIQKLSGVSLAEAVPATAVVRSGKPGRYQAIYRVEPRYWADIRTCKVATDAIGPDGKKEALEFRWTGAQSVVLGHHPETGSYIWHRHPEEQAIADAPLWMIEQMLDVVDEAPLLSLVSSPSVAQAGQRLPRWSDFDKNFRFPVAAAVPLEVAIAPSTRERLSGKFDTGRNDAGIAIASDLIGTAAYLQQNGQRFEGDPEQLFLDWCQRCGLDRDEPRGQPAAIWKSAQKGNKGAALAPEMIEGCIKSWEWKRLKASIIAPAPASAPERLESTPFAEVEPEGITAIALKAAIQEYCEEDDPFQRAILEVQIGAKFKVRGARFSELCSHVLAPAVSEPERLSELVPGYFELISNGVNNHGRGYQIGFPKVDLILGGISTKTSVVIAGRPGMGKTTFMLGIVRQFVANYKQGAAIFSLEMDKESLIDKFVSAEARIPYDRLRVRNLSDSELERSLVALDNIQSWSLSIDDSAGLTIETLKRKAYKIAKEFEADGIKLKCIVVDHIGLMRGASAETEALKLSVISKALLEIAKELDCVMLILSQLNRGVESRADKRPIAADIKASGSVEEDATQIMFIYRDEVYNPSSPDRGIAEIIVAKNRHGPIGTGKVLFDGAYSAFRSIS